MNEDYAVEDLLSNKKKIDKLNKSSILIWYGQQRLSQNLEKGKINKIKKNILDKNLKKIQKISEKAYEEFVKSDWDLKKIGELMSSYWLEKKGYQKMYLQRKLIKFVKLQ